MDIEFYEGCSDTLILGTEGDAPVKGDAVVIGNTKYNVDDVVIVYDPYTACGRFGDIIIRNTQRACVSLRTACPAKHGGNARTARDLA